MKDFIKWLGVNEKVAKVIVWLAIIMGFLILTNAMLDSLGFPNYQINMENLKQINPHKLIEILSGWILVLLSYYSLIFVIFRISEWKKIILYSLLYLCLNVVVSMTFDPGIVQLFIVVFLVVFSYLYSGKNKKYIVFAILSMLLNVIVQGITYIFKVQLLNYKELSYTTQAILSIDYFIIMAMIILVKEIYLKKRGEKECKGIASSGSENSRTKKKSHKKSHKKWLT